MSPEKQFAQAVAHQDAGRWTEAEAVYAKLAVALPDAAPVHWNLGTVRKHQGKWPQAMESFVRAGKLDPTLRGLDFNVGLCLQKAGRTPEAAEAFARAVAVEPDDPVSRYNLAAALRELGRLHEAAEQSQAAIDLAPGFDEAELQLAKIRTALLPQWHLPMMNDAPRNAAYEEAIRRVVRPGDLVLEIGTGSGLLAMMAARAGARVVTCEGDPAIAAVARRIVAANGFADRITVVNRFSSELTVGTELPEPADVLLSEILSSDLLSERVVPAVADARARLLKPGARLIPEQGGVRAVLAGGEHLEKNYFVGEVHGFDLSPFTAITARTGRFDWKRVPFEVLSPSFQAITVDFAGTLPAGPERQVLRVPVTRPGRCAGILQWIWLKLADGVEFENRPDTTDPASGWQTGVFLPKAPVELSEGETVDVRVFHDLHNVWMKMLR